MVKNGRVGFHEELAVKPLSAVFWYVDFTAVQNQIFQI